MFLAPRGYSAGAMPAFALTNKAIKEREKYGKRNREDPKADPYSTRGVNEEKQKGLF